MITTIKLILSSLLMFNFIGFIGSLFFQEHKEKWIVRYCFGIVGLILLHTVLISIIHIFYFFPSFNVYLFSLLKTAHYSFSINLIWDTSSLIFLLTGNIITLMILYFSGYYMHREKGYKRFFNTLMFFYLAYNITVLAGNFTTLFIGWEYLGVSSFLLIAFYRERYLPVRNAVKVFSVYRIGDIGLIISIWATHQLIHENVLFYDLQENSYVIRYADNHPYIAFAIGVGILLAASGKSAIFPFSYWLPRAMEGPTASSAIFYGALSVHMGILLLLRSFYMWENIALLRWIIAILGVVTYFTANKSAKLQASIKAQIAYSSIAQIGVMFMELAMGLKWLVLLHFVSNAFLRSYQLLVSPSVAAYIMKQQMYYSKFLQTKKHLIHYLPERWSYTLFVLAQNEWYLDNWINYYVFGKIKRLGKSMRFIYIKTFLWVIFPLFILAFYVHHYRIHLLNFSEYVFSAVLSVFAVMLIIRAFSERFNPFLVIYLIFFSELFIALSISYNERYDVLSLLLYLSGIFPSFIVAWLILIYMRNKEKNYFDLNKYYGHIYEYRWTGFLFLISILGMMGFPISLTFLGEDIILNHIHPQQVLLAFCFSTHFILTGITGIKLYARLFLGPHCKSYHEKAIKAA